MDGGDATTATGIGHSPAESPAPSPSPSISPSPSNVVNHYDAFYREIANVCVDEKTAISWASSSLVSETESDVFAKSFEADVKEYYADRQIQHSLEEDPTQNFVSPTPENQEFINFQLATIIEAERDLQDLLDSVDQLRSRAKNVHAKISQLSNDICQKLDKEDAKYGLQRVEAGEVDETDSEMSTAVYPSPAEEEMLETAPSMISTSLIFNDDLKELLVRNNELLSRLAEKEGSKEKYKNKISFKPISRLMHRLSSRLGNKDQPTETAVPASDVVEHYA